jgi:hypothetical protein
MKIPALEDIRWMLEFGIPKRKLTFLEIRNNDFKDFQKPVFVLSTGRAGTHWLSELIKIDKSVKVLHSPSPTLASQSSVAYDILCDNPSVNELNLLKEIYLSARENYIRYSVKTQRRLVETNNYITFFAPVLKDLFPDALFVHLIRHPVDFIISGLKRDYYTNKPDDIKRIIPQNMKRGWDRSDRVSKIAALWAETNRFIEEFKSELDVSRQFTLSFSEFNITRLLELTGFMETEVSLKRIENRIDKPSNKQISGDYKKYDSWKQDEKNAVKEICGFWAEKYKFAL